MLTHRAGFSGTQMNAPTVTRPSGMVTMPKDEFEELLERVAEQGCSPRVG